VSAILGIDIGGSGIKANLVDAATGELKAERFKLPTPDPSLPRT
jgi:polyphosphate glucokinase